MKKLKTLLVLSLFFPCSMVFGAGEAEISQLISQLGADDFQGRIEATKKLKEIGQPAQKQLETALSSTDPEIRMRAKEILKDIKLGIRPSWSEELAKKVRGFGKLKTDDKQKLVNKLVSLSEKEAMPFLMTLVDKNDSTDSKMGMMALKSFKDKKELTEKVVEIFKDKEPGNKYEAELYAMAGIETRDFEILKRAIRNPHIPKNIKSDIVKSQKDILEDMLKEKSYEKVIERAAELSESLPDDATILYVQSKALARLKRYEEAGDIAKKALALNPDKEGPHYTAGEYLMKAGNLKLSEMEWNKILEMPPVDGVYDINAYLRLSDIYARQKLYKKALTYLEKGVKKYKAAKEKKGSGMGMVGEEHLDKKIAALKKKAEEHGDVGNQDKPKEKKDYVKFNLNISEKNGKYEEMQKELKTIQGHMAFAVQPYGIGLLKKKIVKMKYDNEKKEFSVTLNNSPCAKPQKFEIKGKNAKIAVFELDTCNIYKVTPETEEVELLKSYDKDYKLRISKGSIIEDWKDMTVKCNGKEHTWEELDKGLPYDYLPEKLNLEITGTTPSGKKEELKFTVDTANKN
jgi:tetratricopeptide (TPR) repeat protein